MTALLRPPLLLFPPLLGAAALEAENSASDTDKAGDSKGLAFANLLLRAEMRKERGVALGLGAGGKEEEVVVAVAGGRRLPLALDKAVGSTARERLGEGFLGDFACKGFKEARDKAAAVKGSFLGLVEGEGVGGGRGAVPAPADASSLA